MKPEFKVEGDKLKISVSEQKAFDTDGDGEAALKASLHLELEADGSEVVDELLKSNTMLEKIKAKLANMGIKI